MVSRYSDMPLMRRGCRAYLAAGSVAITSCVMVYQCHEPTQGENVMPREHYHTMRS